MTEPVSGHPLRARVGHFATFLGAGAVNTIFGYLVFLLLIRLLPFDWLALFFTYVIGLTFNYFVFSRFVFIETIGSIPRFVVSYVIAFALNFALYSVMLRWLQSPAIAQLLCLVPVALATYLLMLWWSFAPDAGADRSGGAPR